MNKLFFLAVTGAVILFGQNEAGVVLPRPVPEFDEVQQHLTLTADQVQKLQAIVRTRQAADQAIWTQISQKHLELNRLLEGGSTDALAIGRLMVDIRELQKQVPGSGDKYRTEALQLLNDAQKAKLAELARVLELQTPAQQAVYLNLLAPRSPDVRILPMPARISAALPLGQ